jgi:hypothetical protein
LSSTPGVGTTITVTIPVDTSNLPVLRTAQEAQQKEDDSPLLLRPRKTKKKRYTGPLSPSK